jgi:hypothetical protein
MVIGLKKEHKQVLDKKTAEHELKVFSVRGETQEATERKFMNRIEELEKECDTLRTLINIQVRKGDLESCLVLSAHLLNCSLIPFRA